ncbi:hypothetical protein ACFYP6_08810 [Streptomyces goshikiensis]|uniref:hypothetical protein n=1 Tax=Streptomyces goshikiensis TaxID=1942 RepID=UPI0036AED121
MTHASFTIPGIDVSTLTANQRDGVACVVCGTERQPMRPVGTVDGGQLFGCISCLDSEPAGPVLVVGQALTSGNVADLRAFAYDVADQVGTSATYAVHIGHVVTDYAALYVSQAECGADDYTAVVLIAEAHSAGIPVYGPMEPAEATRCELCGLWLNVRVIKGDRGDVLCGTCRFLDDVTCGWCGEEADDEEMQPCEFGETWVPVHVACIEEGQRCAGPLTFVTM